MAESGAPKILLVIIAIFISPLAVALHEGITTHFWINLILWLLTWIGGVIHGLWRILS